jgi:hypothetical protein
MFGRGKHMSDSGFNKEEILNTEIINNKNLAEAFVLLNEMYTHMMKRMGIPDFSHEQKGRWGSEGAFSINLSLNFEGFESHDYFFKQTPVPVQVIIHTELLARRDKSLHLQNFSSIERFYEQVKNWHAFEMKLSLDDKTNYFYYENEITKNMRDFHEHHSSNPYE